MTVDHLRSARETVPFVPFTIYMGDGRSYHIPHRDYLSMSPNGRIVIAYHNDDLWSMIDVMLMTEVRMGPSPKPQAADSTAA